MNVFSIKDIENLSGIKAHTLRIWEQRYNLLNPKRKASNHRFYDNEDLKYILRIAYLYNHGHKISYIATLTEDEIRQLALEHQEGCNYEIFINQLTEATLDFDQQRFDKILHTTILRFGLEKCLPQILFPMLKKLGLLWLTGNVIPAQEHFASALIIKKMMMAIDGLEKPVYEPGQNRRVILFTPQGEHHEIPLLFVYHQLRKNGVPALYLGSNVCANTLQLICTRQPATELYFHLITNLIRCDINEYIRKLACLFPDKTIIFSGVYTCTVIQPPSNVRLLKNLGEVKSYCCA